ncbi:MAG: methyltransferase domain-containing protein [Actinobacteria bacterium]|nr:MAG: methyltransferase domain-containing protein [Actinomycetota bacterium]
MPQGQRGRHAPVLGMSVPGRDPGGRTVGAHRDLGAPGSPDGDTGRLVAPLARPPRARTPSRERRPRVVAAAVALRQSRSRHMRVLRALRRALEVVLVERRYAQAQPPAGPPVWNWKPHEKAFAATPWRLLPHLLRPSEVSGDDVFVDFGCGDGRVLLEAAHLYRFGRVVGVEVVPDLAAAARSRLDLNRHLLASPRWEVVRADVLDYEPPDDLTVAYFFDPFTGPVFDAVMRRLEASVERVPRRVRIVYVTPAELHRVLRSGRVRRVRAGVAGRLRTGGRYSYFVGELLPAADQIE